MNPPQTFNGTGILSYEERLDQNFDWALREGSLHFAGKSATHVTLRRIAEVFDRIGVSYAVTNDLAMFFHGFRRFTQTVDLIADRADIERFHHQCALLGYEPAVERKLDLRDTQTGVRIRFYFTGESPGTMPLPITYPSPATASVEIHGLRIHSLPSLIEVKLAAGMDRVRHLRHTADVQELIDKLDLPRDFANELNLLVREIYREHWGYVTNDPCRGMY